MATILLISVNDVNAEGLRLLSACLKAHGHDAHIAFMQKNGFPHTTNTRYSRASRKIEPYDWVGIDDSGREFRYARGPEISAAEMRSLLKLIKEIDPDVIGFTSITPLRKKIAVITRSIKRNFKMPVIWGGIDASMYPEECLKYCDLVCVGEGEQAVRDIAAAVDHGGDIRSAGNLVYRRGGRIVRTPLSRLVTDLDVLPFKDIAPENKYLIEGTRLVRGYAELSYGGSWRYHASSSRGCPFSCSYCGENYYRALYAPQTFLRRRSPAHLVRELKLALAQVKMSAVQFEDEIFSMDSGWLKEFSRLYAVEIGLPISCYIYPGRDIRKKLELLKKAGLRSVCLALQSGSERINREIYNRPFNKKMFLETARLLHTMGISYYTDIITYNPLETETDLRATLDVIRALPKPFGLCINKLYAAPGTVIAQRISERALLPGARRAMKKMFSEYSVLFRILAKYDMPSRDASIANAHTGRLSAVKK